ncbi:hypothetical protein ASC85_01710 [Pseudomonas sp. Root401]|nr:hypothetical protein ASC85_01710 [Pseudomonas sp. Root401]
MLFDSAAQQMSRHILNQSARFDGKSLGRIDQCQITGSQFNCLSCLLDTLPATSLENQKTILVVTVIGIGALTGNVPGVGPDMGNAQPAEIPSANISDE